MNRVTVSSPASSANLGSGYDVFALALREPVDVLTLGRTEEGVKLRMEGVPLTAPSRRNVVSGVVRAIMERENVRAGVSLELEKGVPVGAGLGSSAASSAAAAVGMNALFDLELSDRELVEYAGIGERIASGAAHYDNVTAAIIGGFVVASGSQRFVRIDAPSRLALCLVTPQVALPPRKTEFARSLVPKHPSLDEVVNTVASASMLVHGLLTKNLVEIGEGMQVGFVDPRRAKMIPEFARVRESALNNGAFGVCISGAGPTLLAATTRGKAGAVRRAMIKAFQRVGIQSQGFVTGVGVGCRVIERN